MLPSSCFIAADDVPFDNICDSGASRCAFYSKDFFTTTLITPNTTCFLGGIANGLPIKGFGTATITLKTHKNKTLQLHIPHSLYVPDLTCNLLSPQWLIQSLQKQNKNSSFHVFPHGCLFVLDNHIVPLLYHPTSNLPVFQLLTTTHVGTIATSDPQTSTEELASILLLHGFEASLTSLLTFPLPHQLPTEYANLTAKQQQLYDWHVRLGHMNYATIQSMARKDIGIPRTLATCSPPLCRDCQCGKAKRRSLKNLQPIGERPLRPGEMCCVDQMIAGCPGLPYTMRGRRSSRRYSTCTFFVDVATRFIFPHFQESTNAHETLLGKQRYEQFCRRYQHTVQEYRSDNGIFTDKEFTENLANTGQRHTVAGTGAHHMNGIVERSIGFISTWTLTMLLHAQTRWPQAINKSFWPFATRHAINIYVNCYRGRHGTAIPPIEEFTNMPSLLQLQDLHPWGCPIYVLDKCLQDGNHTSSKWDPRTWLSIYMGQPLIDSQRQRSPRLQPSHWSHYSPVPCCI